MRPLFVFAFLASLVTAAPYAQAQSAVIVDFESYPGPDGRLGTADDVATPTCPGAPTGICAPITAAYSGAGITFASGTLAQGALFPGSAATNHFVSSSPPDVRLSFPVYGVTITSYSNWTAVLHAFDAGGTLIATHTLVNPTAGSGFFLGTLRVATSVPIARFVALEASCTVDGPFCNQILNLDDFVLATAPPAPTPTGTPGPVAVPTASTWSLEALALALLASSAGHLRRAASRTRRR